MFPPRLQGIHSLHYACVAGHVGNIEALLAHDPTLAGKGCKVNKNPYHPDTGHGPVSRVRLVCAGSQSEQAPYIYIYIYIYM